MHPWKQPGLVFSRDGCIQPVFFGIKIIWLHLTSPMAFEDSLWYYNTNLYKSSGSACDQTFTGKTLIVEQPAKGGL